MTTILVTGGRDYRNQARVDEALDLVHEAMGITLLVHGAAEGADTLAHEWARRRQVTPDPHPADWERLDHPQRRLRRNSRGKWYDANAGFRRNIAMLIETAPELVVAFPERVGGGTAHCIAQALRRGIPVLEVDDRFVEALAAAPEPRVVMFDSLKSCRR